MSSVPNLSREPAPFAGELRGGPPGTSLGNPLGAELGDVFQREVQRAVERRGGEQAVAERRTAKESAARAERRASFGQERARDVAPTENEHGARSSARDVKADARSAERPGHDELAGSELGQGAGPAPHVAPTTKSGKPDAASQPSNPSTSAGATPDGPPSSSAISNAAAAVAPGEGAAAGPRASTAAPSVTAVDGAGRTRSAAETARPARPSAAPPAPPSAEELEQAKKILEQLRVGLASGKHQLIVELEPAELGRLHLRMRMVQGKLHGSLRAESAETLHLLEQKLPEVRELLAERGIDVESFELSQGFGRGQERPSGGFRARGASTGAVRSTGALATDTTGARAARPLPATNTGVDLYA